MMGRRILIGLGVVLGVLAVLLVGAGGFVYARSNQLLTRTYTVPEEPLTVAAQPDAATLTEGERLYLARGCTDCHTEDLGGNPDFINDGAVGHLPAPNLTDVAARYETADWVRMLNHGVKPDGTTVILMPSHEYSGMRADEMAALIAYIESAPRVERATPPRTFAPLGRALIAFGQLYATAELIDHDSVAFSTVTVAADVEYGRYLTLNGGCVGCHTATFGGGPYPGGVEGPTVANISPHPTDGIGTWTEADFITAMREGRRPDGTAISPMMPWQSMGASLTDTELAALFAYLQSVPPVTGN